MKNQFIESYHTCSPRPKKLKNQISADNRMVTGYWDDKDTILFESFKNPLWRRHCWRVWKQSTFTMEMWHLWWHLSTNPTILDWPVVLHPTYSLNLAPSVQWRTFFSDNDLMLQEKWAWLWRSRYQSGLAEVFQSWFGLGSDMVQINCLWCRVFSSTFI